MKRKIQRIAAVVLAAVMTASITAGCQKQQATSNSSQSNSSSTSTVNTDFKASKPETFTMLLNDMSLYPYKKDWLFWKKLTEKTNVSLKLTVVDSADYNNKRSLLISSGDAPEIIPKSYPGSETQFVTSGQILPISDYANNNYMPNYCAEVKKWGLQSDVNTLLQSDGKYYVWPELHQSIETDYSLAVRSDILKKNNIKTPDSWDEIESTLKQLKKAYPDITPWSDNWGMGSTMGFAGPAFGLGNTNLNTTQVQWNGGNSLYYNKKTDKFELYSSKTEYKNELTYFNKLMNEGLLDKDSATQTEDQAENKFIDGKSLMISANSQVVNKMRTKMDGTLGQGNYEVKKINIPSGPAGGYVTGNHLENGIMISANAKKDPNFKDLMRFVDWLYFSYNGQEFCKWGVEGQTFTKENGTYKLLSQWKLPSYNQTSTDPNAKDLRQEAGFCSGVFVLSYGGPDALAHSTMSQEDIDFNETITKTRKLLPNAPLIFYDEDQQESQNLLNTTLKDYYNSMSYKFILGQSSLTNDWNSYISALNSKGMKKYVDTANSAYQATKKKLKSSSSSKK